ncbi:uncharacterized protein LOC128555395 [Mercenaria mercenaria]|uniref:uncharacterized protein LOC128555395 n=1 Tax=Mercenaria mercenaria TaxID=6596 RepID=UPI00234EAD8F|nr:uncharacterized protein LOC128555395 [Mercenaria mercenaria]XP_053393639.1 uncharacterized protein LOC128555395 [Mercenaria mercenaria]
MPRSYVDNAMNRSLGRVGMTVGSMPVSKGSSSSYSSGGNGYRSSSRNDYGCSKSSYSSNTYVDNAMNRSLGRVGMAVGSMPVSKGSGYSYSRESYSSSSRNDSSSYSSDTYSNKSRYSGGSGGGDRNDSVNDSVFSSTRHEHDSYVDNAMNRKLDRVGKPLGSMKVSRKSGHYSHSGDDGFNLDDSVFTSNSPGTSDTYVDNAMNRKYGRVGIPLGSMPVSRGSSYGSGNGDERVSRKDSGFSSCSSDTYYDKDYNRKIGREDLQRRSTTSVDDIKSKALDTPSKVKAYVDNTYNRKYERVGLPVGSKVISKQSESTTPRSDTHLSSDSDTKVCKDNPMNRKVGRVGKPLGSAVFSPKEKSTEEKVYMDTKMNRNLGRVGKPLGSMPIGKKSYTTKKARDVIGKMNRKEVQDWVYDNQYTDYDVYKQQGDDLRDAMLEALYHFNRFFEEMTWKIQTSSTEPPKTSSQVHEDYRGRKIPYVELKLASKIGCGGFGEVYFAKWKETVVAVKKLKAESVSKRRLDDFAREMMLYCQLDHTNIVRFIGACVERPNLCIVMEYMQMSLFEAIHIREDIDFSEIDRLNIIRSTCSGLKYLHSLDIAHRDLKTTNVLVNYLDGELEVKITDFGLSSMKGNTQTSSSYKGEIIGTPRYSAPEILLGTRRLTVEDYKKADIYSLSLIIFEVVFEEEPFYDFDIQQLVRYVGRFGISPEIPKDIKPTKCVHRIMEFAWCSKPEDRPDINYVYDVFLLQKKIYEV